MEKTKNTGRYFVLSAIVLSLLVCYLATTVSADVGLDGINVQLVDDDIYAGDEFSVEITFEGPDATENDVDVEIRILFDGIEIFYAENYEVDFVKDVDKKITISSGDSNFENEDEEDVFHDNLMNYDCDDHDIEVEVGGDVSEESDSDTLNIDASGKKELSFEWDPEKPKADEKMTIHVVDEDDDDLKGAKVKFTRLEDNNEWDPEDDSYEGTTDSDGEYSITLSSKSKFRDEPYSKYQVDVYKEDYCKQTEVLDLRQILNVGNPEPSPKVAEEFRIRATDVSGSGVSGAKVTLSPGPIISTTDANGYARFTLQSEGTYTAIASKSDYIDSDIKTFTVSKQPRFDIELVPASPTINSKTTIVVTSGGSSVADVSLKIDGPESITQTVKTQSDGRAEYTPTKPGVYTIEATKTGYDSKTTSFTVKSTMKAVVSNPSAILGTQVTVTVQDATSGAAIPQATVTLQGTTISGMTDAGGKFVFTMPKSGTYNLMVRKDGYGDASASVTSLCVLDVKLSSAEVSVGGKVTITVVDETGSPVTAGINIVKPDGSTETKSMQTYEFTPDREGDYEITAAKANCAEDKITLKAIPLPLEIKTRLSGKNMVITLLSQDNPVEGITVSITTPSNQKKTSTSSQEGIVIVEATETGNYTITVSDPKYGSKTHVAVKPISLIAKYWWIILLLIVVMVILMILAAGGTLVAKKSVKKKPAFEGGGGKSSLSEK